MRNMSFGTSLFCSGGIADLAFKELKISIITANEIIQNRASIFEHNYPDTKMIQGDINDKKDDLIKSTFDILNGKELTFLFATPPCQGMSKNGQGKLLNLIRKGLKPKFDKRNELIIPVVEIIKKLLPKTIVLENVPEMRRTLIPTKDHGVINILEFLEKELTPKYTGTAEIVDFCDYGIPQHRKRLITIYTRDRTLLEYYKRHNSFLPKTTHERSASNGKEKWITIRDIIYNFPSLDGKNSKTSSSDIPYHNVPILDEKKYFWISNTPEERSSFDNQCIECNFKDNPNHSSKRGEDGINRASRSTPIRCVNCNSLLPRPWVEKNGEYRIMKGFTSAYKRMKWDKPASALTRNLSYVSSDHKIHPSQNRVLSLYEAFHLHTISDYKYEWKMKNGIKASNKLIRDVIGESVPPRGMEIIVRHLNEIMQKKKISMANKVNVQKDYLKFV